MKAKDLMNRDVMTVHPLMEIGEAARFLTEKHITGAPVVDEKGNLRGVVSQTDLTRFHGRRVPDSWHAEEWADLKEDPEGTPVIAVMTDNPVTCDEEAPIEDVSHLMLERRIHRVLVTKGGKLSGIITTMDLLRALPSASSKGLHCWPE